MFEILGRGPIHASHCLHFRNHAARSRARGACTVSAAVKLPARLAEKHASRAKQRAAGNVPAEPKRKKSAAKSDAKTDKRKQKPVLQQEVPDTIDTENVQLPQWYCHPTTGNRCSRHGRRPLLSAELQTSWLRSAHRSVRTFDEDLHSCPAAQPAYRSPCGIGCEDRAVAVSPACRQQSVLGAHSGPGHPLQPRPARSRCSRRPIARTACTALLYASDPRRTLCALAMPFTSHTPK